MPKNETKPRPPEADELTVQFSVPRELLQQLSELDDEATRVGPAPEGLVEEQTLLMQPGFSSSPAAAAAIAAAIAAQRASTPPPPPRAPGPRPMTPVTISEAELRALLRPQRVARVVATAVVLLAALAAVALVLWSGSGR